MIVMMLLFGLLIFGISYIMGKESTKMEKGELSLYIVLISWGSLFIGLFLARISN
ncbi:MAG: hypothetical protein AB1553_00355 [Nitrospirota bacterium]